MSENLPIEITDLPERRCTLRTDEDGRLVSMRRTEAERCAVRRHGSDAGAVPMEVLWSPVAQRVLLD